MTTAIIGTGNIGSSIARGLVAGGEKVLLASANQSSAEELASRLGGKATTVSVEDAFDRADTIILAVWFDVSKELLTKYREQLHGKLIIDPSNAIALDDGDGFIKTIGDTESAGQILQSFLPADASLVKAFGTLAAPTLAAATTKHEQKIVGFYAADDEPSSEKAEQLLMAAGLDPIRVGGIDQSSRIEVFGDLHEFGALGKTVNRQEALAAI
ncbi:NADPH-dependent F420 reductase [Psychromicrobium sp. YIM B11713]|uniref:NADPH-dependent F420 reductase n=1 Tax=Psychromicrobium sp. YIM B11713 TaxID=3145233 RepID=UPI00374F57FA